METVFCGCFYFQHEVYLEEELKKPGGLKLSIVFLFIILSLGLAVVCEDNNTDKLIRRPGSVPGVELDPIYVETEC